MGTKRQAVTLGEGERVLFEQRSTARLPRAGWRRRRVPGTVTVTNRRVVHTPSGVFGLGAAQHVIPLPQVTMVATAAGLSGSLEISTDEGTTASFRLSPSVAEQVAERIRTAQVE